MVKNATEFAEEGTMDPKKPKSKSSVSEEENKSIWSDSPDDDFDDELDDEGPISRSEVGQEEEFDFEGDDD